MRLWFIRVSDSACSFDPRRDGTWGETHTEWGVIKSWDLSCKCEVLGLLVKNLIKARISVNHCDGKIISDDVVRWSGVTADYFPITARPETKFSNVYKERCVFGVFLIHLELHFMTTNHVSQNILRLPTFFWSVLTTSENWALRLHLGPLPSTDTGGSFHEWWVTMWFAAPSDQSGSDVRITWWEIFTPEHCLDVN